MTLKPVNEVPKPEVRAAKHDLKGMLKEFVESKKTAVKVVLIADEYKSPQVCRCCLLRAVSQHQMPVRVLWRDGEIYLEKK